VTPFVVTHSARRADAPNRIAPAIPPSTAPARIEVARPPKTGKSAVPKKGKTAERVQVEPAETQDMDSWEALFERARLSGKVPGASQDNPIDLCSLDIQEREWVSAYGAEKWRTLWLLATVSYRKWWKWSGKKGVPGLEPQS
jgi:hypothetical protein